MGFPPQFLALTAPNAAAGGGGAGGGTPAAGTGPARSMPSSRPANRSAKGRWGQLERASPGRRHGRPSGADPWKIREKFGEKIKT